MSTEETAATTSVPLKLHLGCGTRILRGFTNVDIAHRDGVNRVDDIRTLSTFADGAADEVYCSHALEHFDRRNTLDILRCWNRVLATGGRLYVAVPDFAAICKVYAEDGLPHLEGLLCGGQRHQ